MVRGRASLGQPVRLNDTDAKTLLDASRDIRRERRGGAERVLHGAELRGVKSRRIRERKQHGRHQVKHGHLVRLNDAHQRIEIEALHQDLMCAGSQRCVHQHHAVDVREREKERVGVGGADAAGVEILRLVADERAVGEHHALRQAGRAARVRKRGELALIDPDVGRVRGS